MASPSPRAYFRTSLRAVLDISIGGPPALPSRVIRFGLWPSWRLAAPGPPAPPAFAIVRFTVLAPELPYSILPFFIRQGSNVAVDLTAPPTWQGHPVPSWRGIPCRIGSAVMRLRNDIGTPAQVDFPVQVLLPDRDPPGPRPDQILLGTQFLRHYGLRVGLNYPAIQYLDDPVTGRRRIDPSVPCGSLSLR